MIAAMSARWHVVAQAEGGFPGELPEPSKRRSSPPKGIILVINMTIHTYTHQ